MGGALNLEEEAKKKRIEAGKLRGKSKRRGLKSSFCGGSQKEEDRTCIVKGGRRFVMMISGHRKQNNYPIAGLRR